MASVRATLVVEYDTDNGRNGLAMSLDTDHGDVCEQLRALADVAPPTATWTVRPDVTDVRNAP